MGTLREGDRIREDISIVANSKYLVRLEDRVGVDEMDRGGGGQVVSDGCAKAQMFQLYPVGDGGYWAAM